MVDWYLDAALTTLSKQLRVRHPKLVIGTIGDPAHASHQSDHNPEADRSVDAIDPMLGGTYTHTEAQRDVDTLVRNRDYRIAYLIWNRRIISSTVNPWQWRAYNGSDHHTNHWHLSRNDIRESDGSEWKGFPTLAPQRKITWEEFPARMPRLREGDSDDNLAGYDRIRRIQRLVGFTGKDVDGVWGPKTSIKLGYKEMTKERWQKLLGLGTP